MLRYWAVCCVGVAALTAYPVVATAQGHGEISGTVTKIDNGAKTMAVKTADGTEHVYHVASRTAVHGMNDAAADTKDAFHGVKEGTEVAVHYTAKGTVETADEIDDVGHEGMHSADVTVTKMDRGAKTMTVKTENGTEETYHMTANAAEDAGTDVKVETGKAAHATVYYTEEGGHKVVHFFKGGN